MVAGSKKILVPPLQILEVQASVVSLPRKGPQLTTNPARQERLKRTLRREKFELGSKPHVNIGTIWWHITMAKTTV